MNGRRKQIDGLSKVILAYYVEKNPLKEKIVTYLRIHKKLGYEETYL